MATPNYGYEKRQKELAKKRKKEDKLRDKVQRKQGGPGEPDYRGDADSTQAPDNRGPAAPTAT